VTHAGERRTVPADLQFAAVSELFIAAFLLGVAYCAPPGGVTAETIRRGARGGFRSAALVQGGSILGDLLWAVVALIGAAFLVQNPIARILLGGVGVLLMAWLAFSALRDVRRGGMPTARADEQLGDFRAGALLATGNPFAVPFWLGLGGGTVAQLNGNSQMVDLLVFFGAFLLATVVWALGMSSLVAFGKRFVNATLFRAINLACGLFLGYKAVELLLNVVKSLAR
jgi:threonine/homoserine/homoserine lactone efflux protein